MASRSKTSGDDSKMLARSASIMNAIARAYDRASVDFHEYFKREFDLLLRTSVRTKEKYIRSLYNDSDLNQLIDDAVRYRIGMSNNEPDKNKFIYSMNDPFALGETLDDILQKIMYSAYPEDVVRNFRCQLVNYNIDDRIIDVVMSKLELPIGM